MITNINELKAELIARDIAREDEMSGCSESEILEIETKYGKLPLSYRQIISLIGHSAGFLSGDSCFYVSCNDDIDRILLANEEYREYKKETIESDRVEETDDLLKIPEYIFIIHSWDGNHSFVLIDPKEQKQDSPVYVYHDTGKVEQESLSVWKLMDGMIKHTLTEGRSSVSEFWSFYYRKPLYTKSGKIIIKKGY